MALFQFRTIFLSDSTLEAFTSKLLGFSGGVVSIGSGITISDACTVPSSGAVSTVGVFTGVIV
jgi:hypothetical protein